MKTFAKFSTQFLTRFTVGILLGYVTFFRVASAIESPIKLGHNRLSFEMCVNKISGEVADEKNYAAMLAETRKDNPITKYESQYGLTDDDVVSIYAYTRDFFDPVNNALWGGRGAQYFCFTQQLNSALRKLPDYDGIVVRGARLPRVSLSQHVPGHIVTYLGYTSASIGQISPNFEDAPEYLTIHSKHGKRIEDLTVVRGEESEVLFLTETRFLILSRKQPDSKGPILIEMEEID